MLSTKSDTLRREFEAFAKGAYLELLVPKSAEFQAAAVLRAGKPETLQTGPSRRHLFFDEYTDLQVVLRSSLAERALSTLLLNLSLTVNATATDAVPAEGRGNAASASEKHDVVTETFAAGESVELVPVGERTYAVWKPSMHLVRPRLRLQRPAIYFTATVSLSAAAFKESQQGQNDYLKSCEPLPANLLQPFNFDPTLSAAGIYLSESLITKVAPPAPRLDVAVKPLRGASKRAFPCVPALFTRVKCSPLPDAAIASLHIDPSQLIAGTVSLQDVSFTVPGVQITPLNVTNWPQQTHAGDEVILLYKLEQQHANTTANAASVLADVSIKATAELDQCSHINLALTFQNPVQLAHTPKGVYKWSQPLTASQSPPHNRLQSRNSTSALPSPDRKPNPPTTGEGITFNFTAPARTTLNAEFALSVQCINRSTRAHRFALMSVQPKPSHQPRPVPFPAASQPRTTSSLIAEPSAAPPPPVHSKPQNALCLTPDLRVGPLPPGACFETEMRFRAAGTGLLELGLVRIFDLDGRRSIDVRELPDVVALEREASAAI